MTTELEQEFFNTFGIEPKHNKKSCKHCKYHTKSNFYDGCIKDINFISCPNAKIFYPKITDRKLLEMICIWNYIMPCIDDCIIPIDYLGLKSVILDKMIRYSEIEYEFDVDALKYQIKQLFNET